MMYLEADERWVLRMRVITTRMIMDKFGVGADDAAALMDKYKEHGLIDEHGNVIHDEPVKKGRHKK